MNVIDRSALVPYSTTAMYALVNAIEAYPQFMDGCVGARVLSETEELMEARLDLAKGALRYSFTTRNRLLPPERIELTLVEGPFDHFAGRWEFHPLGEAACKVSLHLEFAMAGRLRSFAARTLFNGVANNLVDALVRRAHSLYRA
jgi:ribosome-associated toxin RatA of RatAB toxin-antitoxin module